MERSNKNWKIYCGSACQKRWRFWIKKLGGIGHLICPENICQLDGEFDTEIGCILVGGYNISNKRFSFVGTGEPKIPL